jgi:hypothetical protein
MPKVSRDEQRHEIMQAAEAMAILASTFAEVASDPNSTQKALNACTRLILDLTELMKEHQQSLSGYKS